MSRSNNSYVKRHIKIINYLKVKPLSYDEIFRKLQHSMDDMFSYSLRTFQRDLKAIESLYSFQIKYSRSNQKYEIIDSENNNSNNRMVESIELVDILSKESKKSLILDSRKGQIGAERFEEIFEAIENKYKMKMNYKKFGETKERFRVIYPLAIKESRFRWYLIAEDESDHKVKSFAFDRITALSASQESFTQTNATDIESLFKDYIGVNRQVMFKKTLIVLETQDESQVYYLQSLPIHSSQEIVQIENKKYEIKLNMVITYDLILELMYLSSSVKVTSPLVLADEMQSQLRKALSLYES